VPDAQPPSDLAPPAPPPTASPDPTSDVVPSRLREPRPGELSPPWRIALILTWVGAFLAYMAVWKTSEELGLATWWLGPRSNPQPVVVRVIPFVVIAVFGVFASYNVRRLPWISLGGSVALALIAVPDLSRSTGIATIEFAIAVAVALVSVASLTGRYRAASTDSDR
jgi:hypothetical protein